MAIIRDITDALRKVEDGDIEGVSQLDRIERNQQIIARGIRAGLEAFYTPTHAIRD